MIWSLVNNDKEYNVVPRINNKTDELKLMIIGYSKNIDKKGFRTDYIINDHHHHWWLLLIIKIITNHQNETDFINMPL